MIDLPNVMVVISMADYVPLPACPLSPVPIHIVPTTTTNTWPAYRIEGDSNIGAAFFKYDKLVAMWSVELPKEYTIHGVVSRSRSSTYCMILGARWHAGLSVWLQIWLCRPLNWFRYVG